MSQTTAFDIAVLGSGFAGSLTALILAKSGLRVALIDRGNHPRFAIGESSTPAADYLLEQLCDEYSLSEIRPLCRYGTWRSTYPDVRCGCKRGFSYVWHGNGNDYRPTVDHECELMVAASSSTQTADTQWYRPELDRFIFEISQRYGTVTFESTEIAFAEPPTASSTSWRLGLRRMDEDFVVEARFIIDGSGPNSKFYQHQSPRDLKDTLQTHSAAIYTHFRGCQSTARWLEHRGADCSDFPFEFDLAAVHHVFHQGWLWKIGFDGDITSVGFVRNLRSNSKDMEFGNSVAQPSAGTDWSDQSSSAWDELLRANPVLREVIGDSRLAEVPGRIFTSSRLQRLTAPAAGSTWAALPFTIGFIDPLHSTGIAHSLSGVQRICDALLANSELKKHAKLVEYSDAVVQEIQHIDSMISGCYDSLCDFRLFNCWTMLYFAAVTTFERLHREGQSPSFLLAGDESFRMIVRSCRQLLDELLRAADTENSQIDSPTDMERNQRTKLLDSGCNPPMRPPSENSIDRFVEQFRKLIEPYNQVGLFAPQRPNMYWHTVAK